MAEILLSLCEGHYVRLDCFAQLVNRSPNTLQGQYLTRLCREHRLRLDDLREFIDCYNPANRHKGKETWHAEKNPEGRWRKYSFDELASRDKISLDLFWLKDDCLADLDNLPGPMDLADKIVENLMAGLANFRTVAASLRG